MVTSLLQPSRNLSSVGQSGGRISSKKKHGALLRAGNGLPSFGVNVIPAHNRDKPTLYPWDEILTNGKILNEDRQQGSRDMLTSHLGRSRTLALVGQSGGRISSKKKHGALFKACNGLPSVGVHVIPAHNRDKPTLNPCHEILKHGKIWNPKRPQGSSKRFFSSSAPGEKKQNDLQELHARLYQRVVEICDDTMIPYGEFSPELWDESLRLLKQLTELKSAFGLECSCTLLERLVIEQSTPRSNPDGFLPKLTTDTLNLVVDNWILCWQRQGPVQTKVTPPDMLSLIDDWLYRLDNALHPDVKTYGTLIKGAAANHQTDPAEAMSFAASLFHRMMEESNAQMHPNVRPDNFVYSTLIHLLAQEGEVQRAEFYLNEMYMEFARGNSAVEPNVKIFTSLLTGYSNIAGTNRDPGNEVPARAESILRHMQHLHDSGTLQNVKPNTFVYSLVLQCYSKSKDPQTAVEPSLRLYNEMKNSRDSTLRPTIQALGRVMYTLCTAHDGEAANALLEEHLENEHLPNPDKATMRSAMLAWDKRGGAEALEKVEKILQKLKDLPFLVNPDTVAYNVVLNRLVGHPRDAPAPSMEERVKRAEEIVKEMEDWAEAGEKQAKPSTFSYNLLIHLHALESQDPFRAEDVLERMYRFHIADGKSESTRPNRMSFNLCVKAWADHGGDNGPKRAEGILRRMWKLHKSNVLPDVAPDAICYTTVLRAISASRQLDAGEKCQELVGEMKANSVKIDEGCYGLIVLAFARANHPEKAEAELEEWIGQHKQGTVKGAPSENIFTSVLFAWSRSSNPDAGQKAHDLINRMHRLHDEGLLPRPPDRSKYEILLKTWANSKNPWACEHAETVLHQMEAMAAAGNQAIAPTLQDYNVVLYSCARAGRGGKAQELLDWMLNRYRNEEVERCRPNLETFSLVLRAWKHSKESDSPDRVESTLALMEQLSQDDAIEGIKPDAHCLNLALGCLAKQERGVSPQRVESLLRRYEASTNSESWITVLLFCASLGNARKAENIMRSMYHSNSRCVPDTVLFTIVITAYKNSVEAEKGEKAEALLREMYERHEKGEDVKPNSVTFGAVLQCYLRSDGDPKAIMQKVEALRDEVIARTKSGEEGVSYDNRIFYAVMQAHCSQGDPEDAQTMLEQVCEEVTKGKNKQGWQLDALTLNSVLGAWVRSDKPDRAEAILHRMRQFRDQGVPDITTIPRNYLVVIECWMRSNEPLAAERADSVLQMMELDHPKVVAGKGLYLSVMKGLAQSGSGERAEALLRRVQTLFEDERRNTEIDLFLYREVCLAWKNSSATNASERIELLEEEISERFSATATW